MAWEWAFPFTTFSTTCKSGSVHTFEVRTEGVSDSEGDGWLYYARPIGVLLADEQEYFASFQRVAPDLFQLDGMKNGLPTEYQGCGITRALIPHVARQHGVRIRSSRHRPLEGETRTAAATAVWQGLIRDNVASYDISEDRFYYPPVDRRLGPA